MKKIGIPSLRMERFASIEEARNKNVKDSFFGSMFKKLSEENRNFDSEKGRLNKIPDFGYSKTGENTFVFSLPIEGTQGKEDTNLEIDLTTLEVRLYRKKFTKLDNCSKKAVIHFCQTLLNFNKPGHEQREIVEALSK